MTTKDRCRPLPGGKSLAIWLARRLDHVISLSRFEKSLFVTFLIVAALVLAILGIWLNLALTDGDRNIDRAVAVQAIQVCTLFLAGNLILMFVYYYFSRVRLARDFPPWLITVAVVADVGQVFYTVYLLGLYSWGIVIPIITALCARVLYGRRVGALTLVLCCLSIVLFSVLYLREAMPYGPFFHSDIGQVYRNPVLNLTSCGLTLFVLLLFYGVMDFVTHRMHNLSVTDGLTRITNRRSFMEVLEIELQRARRQKKAFSVVMIDLDHFKQVNDRHGHHVGDRVLRCVADVLATETRSYDTVARYGGEEFVMLLPGTEREEAVIVAERCRSRIGECAVSATDSLSVHITASMGLVHYPDDTVENVDDLLRLADEALYEAKAAGRNRVVLSGNGERRN